VLFILFSLVWLEFIRCLEALGGKEESFPTSPGWNGILFLVKEKDIVEDGK